MTVDGVEITGDGTRIRPRSSRNGMSFGIYLAGFVVVIAGLIYAASLVHIPTH